MLLRGALELWLQITYLNFMKSMKSRTVFNRKL
jgi:hypothetical protein